MKTTKVSTYNGPKDTDPIGWMRDVNSDLETIFLCLSGRIRFGPNNNVINKGENILGQFINYTSNATPDTQDTVPHSLASIPVGYIVVNRNKNGGVYTSAAATSTNLYLKCSVASTTLTLFVLQ